MAVFTPLEYSNNFTFGGKKMSPKTIIRRCINNQLPRNHKAYNKSGKWIIEVPDEVVNQNILKNYNIQITLKGQQKT